MRHTQPTRTRRAGRSAGFTLLELMVTIALAAVLLSLSAGAFLSLGKRSGYQTSLASVAGLIKKAQNSSSQTPSSILLDPENGVLLGLTEKTLQELRFELRTNETGGQDWTQGIDGLDVTVTGGEVEENIGRVGGGLRMQGGSVDCGNYAPYDVSEGFAIEVWINSDSDRGVSSPLVSKGRAFEIHLNARQAQPARLRVKIGVSEKGQLESVTRTVDLPPVRLGEWFGVIVVYDRRELVTYTDEGFGPVERDRHTETRELMPEPDADLVLGGDGFYGVMDDFRFGGIHSDDPVRLPQGVTLVGEQRRIHFANGRLDSRVHAGVESIALRHEGKTTLFEIGQNGLVQDIRYLEGDDTVDDAIEREEDANRERKE